MNIKIAIGSLTILMFLIVSLVLSLIPGAIDPFSQNLSKEFSPAETGHILGFGENGVDVFSQVLWSAKFSLSLSVFSVLFALVVGTVFGFMAAWYSSWYEFVFLRVVEVFESFPGILLVVAMAAFLGPSPKNIFIVLVLNSWVGFAKMTRVLVLRLKNVDFVMAGKAIGVGTPKLFWSYIRPSIQSELGVLMAQSMGSALIVESSLSYLGLGFPPATPSWGGMLNQAREVIVSAPHVILVPSFCIFLSTFSFQLIGEGLRQNHDGKVQQPGTPI
jgi:peptide/nickel transport system permease protein